MSETEERITSSAICAALRTRYPLPSHALFYEVADGTGMNAGRRIDALGIGIWPSTGQEIHGIEIKVSRSDWKREIANPKKAQDLMRFCNRWYLACPAGLVEASEVPETWGLLTVKGGVIREQRKAPRLSPEPPTRDFLCSLLRSAGGIDAAVVESAVQKALQEERRDREAKIESAIKRDREFRSRRAEEAAAKVERIEKMIGVPLDQWAFDDAEFAKAVNLVRNSGVLATYAGIMGLAAQAEQAAARIRSALATFDGAVKTDEGKAA